MSGPSGRSHWVFPAQRRHLLVSRERYRIMPPVKTLRSLGLRAGMTFLDVGCGNGFFAVSACRVVGRRGETLACDLSPIMLRETRALARKRGLENLRTKRATGASLPFEDGLADLALVAFVLHEAPKAGELLSETRRVLKPGGCVALIEWHKKETDMGPPLWSRFRPPEVKRELRRAGFLKPKWWDFDGNTYFVSAQAPGRA